MDLTPPGEETPKDYATRRIDLEQPEIAANAPGAEKKSRTRKTSARPVEPAAPALGCDRTAGGPAASPTPSASARFNPRLPESHTQE